MPTELTDFLRRVLRFAPTPEFVEAFSHTGVIELASRCETIENSAQLRMRYNALIRELDLFNNYFDNSEIVNVPLSGLNTGDHRRLIIQLYGELAAAYDSYTQTMATRLNEDRQHTWNVRNNLITAGVALLTALFAGAVTYYSNQDEIKKKDITITEKINIIIERDKFIQKLQEQIDSTTNSKPPVK